MDNMTSTSSILRHHLRKPKGFIMRFITCMKPDIIKIELFQKVACRSRGSEYWPFHPSPRIPVHISVIMIHMSHAPITYGVLLYIETCKSITGDALKESFKVNFLFPMTFSVAQLTDNNYRLTPPECLSQPTNYKHSLNCGIS